MISGPTLESAVTLKSWVEQRLADPYVDIRAQEPSGAYHFSFRANSAEQIKDWIENQSSGQGLQQWGKRRARS